MCPSRGKFAHEGKNEGCLTKTPLWYLTKKAKIMKRNNCVHEGENVPMKDKSKGLQLKLLGGTLRKSLDYHEKGNSAYDAPMTMKMKGF